MAAVRYGVPVLVLEWGHHHRQSPLGATIAADLKLCGLPDVYVNVAGCKGCV